MMGPIQTSSRVVSLDLQGFADGPNASALLAVPDLRALWVVYVGGSKRADERWKKRFGKVLARCKGWALRRMLQRQ